MLFFCGKMVDKKGYLQQSRRETRYLLRLATGKVVEKTGYVSVFSCCMLFIASYYGEDCS